MISVFPSHLPVIACPRCESDVQVDTIFFQGIHVLADGVCASCQLVFFQTLAMGHAIFFPVAFSKDGLQTWFNPRAGIWMAQPLINSMITDNVTDKTSFEVKVYKQHPEVVIVNCNDTCFGHVFAKLWNVELLLKKNNDIGIVVLLPANCAWLVPVGVAEVWIVDTPLKNFKNKITGLDAFVKEQFSRFKKVELSDTPPYIDHQFILLQKFVKTERFRLDEFEQRCQITFVLREDRFWHNSIVMDFLFKASVKFKIQKSVFWFFIFRQNRLVNRTISRAKKQLPHARFSICGLGKTGKYKSYIKDYRTVKITSEVEKEWNSVFAQSNIVIGVHGSSMLIPTSLAAGFIDLVPRYKIPHLTEDTVLPYSNRYLSFLGRYLDEYSSPRLVATHLVSMISDFPYFYKNTEREKIK